MDGLMLHAGSSTVGRQELLTLPTPEVTDTHKPVAHSAVVEAVIESLAYRRIEVVNDEYAIGRQGLRMFGFLALNIEHNGVRLGLGLRNSHDKSFPLGITVGYRVFICDNLAFRGEFTPVTRRHTKNFNLVETVSMAVDRAQRYFVPLTAEIDAWRNHSLTDGRAKELIYNAFIGGDLDVPRHLARDIHRNYFQPEHAEFEPRTMWSLQNAFTSALKQLDPVPRFNATAAVGQFFAGVS